MSGTLGLVRVMAEAERLRWHLLLQRCAVRGGLALGGLVFLCIGLAMLHVLAVAALTPLTGLIAALGIVTAFDLVVGFVLMLCAARNVPGEAERTAAVLRDSARSALMGRARMMRVLPMLIGVLRRR